MGVYWKQGTYDRMKPLIVLLLVFFVAVFFSPTVHVAGNIAMACMLFFTSIGHFKFTDGMAKMLPPQMPSKHFVVYVTGLLEIALGIGLLFPSTRRAAGITLVVFLIIFLPANILAARQGINYETGQPGGPGLKYLWFRIPLQVLFVAWTVYFSVV